MWLKLTAALILPISLLAMMVFIWKIPYRLAGELLLSLPKSKNQKFIALTVSIALFVIGSYVMSQETAEDQNILYTAIGGGGLYGLAVSFWLQNFWPIELREKGMIFSGSLIRWSRIESYQWQDTKQLLLKFKPLIWNGYRKLKIQVAPAKREKVEDILLEKLSTSKNKEMIQ